MPDQWNRGTDPGQRELSAWLDYGEGLVAADLAGPGPRVLELTVAVPAGKPVIGAGGDLDNYLRPLIHRLGARRFPAAFATKATASRSLLTVGPVKPHPGTLIAPNLSVRVRGSYQLASWRGQIRAAWATASQLDPEGHGPVRLVLALITSHLERNWSVLWKPAIDALTPLLGLDPHAPKLAPRVDRLTDLALHHNFDGSLGWDVVVDAWWETERP